MAHVFGPHSVRACVVIRNPGEALCCGPRWFLPVDCLPYLSAGMGLCLSLGTHASPAPWEPTILPFLICSCAVFRGGPKFHGAQSIYNGERELFRKGHIKFDERIAGTPSGAHAIEEL